LSHDCGAPRFKYRDSAFAGKIPFVKLKLISFTMALKSLVLIPSESRLLLGWRGLKMSHKCVWFVVPISRFCQFCM